LIGVLLAEFATPLAEGFVCDDNPTGEQQLFDIAVAETEAEKQPLDSKADDLGWEMVILVAVGGSWCVHTTDMSHNTAASQVDNARREEFAYRA
jgi:hypothetical protein